MRTMQVTGRASASRVSNDNLDLEAAVVWGLYSNEDGTFPSASWTNALVEAFNHGRALRGLPPCERH